MLFALQDLILLQNYTIFRSDLLIFKRKVLIASTAKGLLLVFLI